jgi:TPR repeat protein
MPRGPRIQYFDPPAADGKAAAAAQKRAEANAAAAEKARRQHIAQAQRSAILDIAQWRIVDGVTNSVRDPGWFHFYGEVRKVETNGLVVHGVLAPLNDETPALVQSFFEGASLPSRRPDSVGPSAPPDKLPQLQDFFLVNFPHPVVTQDVLEPKKYYMAKYVGIIEHGNDGHLRQYDYGQPSAFPPPDVEAKLNAKKNTADNALLRFEQAQAAKGSATYQRRLGLRYLQGKGVERDPAKGREWLLKAAAQGDTEAAEALKKL